MSSGKCVNREAINGTPFDVEVGNTDISGAVERDVKSGPKSMIRLALVHYPVKGRKGETIASAITNLDLHDIARTAKTYDIERFYVVTPLKDQKSLAEKIMSHWQQGAGASYNPDRGKAFDLVRVVADIGEVVADIESHGKTKVKIVATSAVNSGRSTGFNEFKEILAAPANKHYVYLLVLGTAWGLADEVLDHAHYILSPICEGSAYNHLSVRSAAAIMMDRILGDASA